jgi:F-type H+-transporting ATPase subunit b
MRPGSRARLIRSIQLFLFLATLLIGLSAGARAQATSPARTQEPVAGEPAKESKKAESEDEQAQFKHSWMVQWVAKVTGLSVDNAYWLCVVLNFAVVAAAVVYLSKKNLPGMFRNRSASIQQAMQEAQQASQDANRRLSEIEDRLTRLDSEIGGLRANAEKEAVAEEARIKAAAEEDARKIVESADQEIAAAAKLARRELTNFAADLAVSLAARQIKVDQSTDQSLVRHFAQDLAAQNPNGGDLKTGQDKN